MDTHFKIRLSDYTFKLGTHRDKSVIWIIFDYDSSKIQFVKHELKAKWSQSKKAWYLADVSGNRKVLGLEIQWVGNRILKNIHPVNLPAFQRYIEHLKLKSYSPNTIKTYSVEFAQLLTTIKSTPVENLDSEKLRSYFLYCIDHFKLSENTIHSRMNAVKFYFDQVLNRPKFFMEIPRPKKQNALPKVLSQNDIRKMFAVTENPKHKLLLQLCYGMGLRVSELVNLKISDIDSHRMQVLVNQGKGKKDRYVVLPDSVLEQMRNYFKAFQPKDYLFEGQKGHQYAARSAQKVFKEAMRKARINKPIGIHSLRHSYATHLIEQGTDIRFVQELLGHNDLKTTMNYTHLTDSNKRKIKSPLDTL